jgi:hypothetical protein
MPELAWYAFGRDDRITMRRKEFPNQEALQKFAARMAESTNFYQFYGTRD